MWCHYTLVIYRDDDDDDGGGGGGGGGDDVTDRLIWAVYTMFISLVAMEDKGGINTNNKNLFICCEFISKEVTISGYRDGFHIFQYYVRYL